MNTINELCRLYSAYDLCMLYSAIASIFVIFCILFNQTSVKTALSQVSVWLCWMLLFHAVIISFYSLIAICVFDYKLDDLAFTRFIRIVLGFVMGFVSFSYPYVIFCLIRYYIKGKKILSGFIGKNTFFLYIATSILYIIGAVYVVSLDASDEVQKASDHFEFFSITPIVLIIFYVLVIKDLNSVIKEAVANSFMSKTVRLIILYIIVYLPIILGPVGWIYKTPISFICVLSLVYVIQLVSHDRAISLDFLTGLNNRNELQRYLSRLFEKVDGLDHTLNIIFIDINDFKMVNDTYGHNQGDKALLAVSGSLKKAAFSANCFICRYAGDEFTVVIKESSLKSADDYVNEVLDNLKAINDSHEYPFEISISVGKTKFNPKFKSVADFVEAADRKMYEEKQKYKLLKAKAQSESL